MKNAGKVSIVLGMIAVAVFVLKLRAAEAPNLQTYEYATIKWAGREFTHIIKPSGQIEFLGPLFKSIKPPERADERAVIMNIAINAAAREGYEVAAMESDRVLMRRAVAK